MYKIMIVEDNENMRERLGKLLRSYGYDVYLALDFDAVPALFAQESPALLLLDINLPTVNGFHIAEEIRKTSSVPIIFVTSRDSNMDEVMAMSLGGDDFITKPFNTEVLVARIASVLRRAYERGNAAKMEHRGVQLDLGSASVAHGGEMRELTKNEFRILYYLLEHCGTVVSREDLMNHLWDNDVFLDDNTLTVNVNRLRKKLAEIGVSEFISTRRGQGYLVE